MLRKILAWMAIALCISFVGPARAAVQYSYALYSSPLFAFVAPDFITSNYSGNCGIPPSLSCTFTLAPDVIDTYGHSVDSVAWYSSFSWGSVGQRRDLPDGAFSAFGTYTDGIGTLTVAPAGTIPEPGTLALLGLGLAGLAVTRRRKQ